MDPFQQPLPYLLNGIIEPSTLGFYMHCLLIVCKRAHPINQKPSWLAVNTWWNNRMIPTCSSSRECKSLRTGRMLALSRNKRRFLSSRSSSKRSVSVSEKKPKNLRTKLIMRSRHMTMQFTRKKSDKATKFAWNVKKNSNYSTEIEKNLQINGRKRLIRFWTSGKDKITCWNK